MRSQSQQKAVFFLEIGIFSVFVIFIPSHHLDLWESWWEPSMFGPGDAEDSDDTRATALPGPSFSLVFSNVPGFIQRDLVSWNLISRKQLVYPRRKRWPLGSALWVSLLCQICSFPIWVHRLWFPISEIDFSFWVDVRSISPVQNLDLGALQLFRTKSNLSFVKQNRPELFKGQGQQVQETALLTCVGFYRT